MVSGRNLIPRHCLFKTLRLFLLQVKRILLSTNSLFKSEDTALDLALAWTQQDLSIGASIFPALLGKHTLLNASSLFKTEDTALDLALAWTQQDLSNRASIFPALLGKSYC